MVSKYDWLLEYKETYAYNYERHNDEIIGCPVVIEGKTKAGVKLSWAYEDRGSLRQYTGIAKIKDRNLYVYSRRSDGKEDVLTIFPTPSNGRFEILWGVAVGVTGYYPCAFKVLYSSKKLSPIEVKEEFEFAGVTQQNSLMVMKYDPDDLRSAREIKEQERIKESISFMEEYRKRPDAFKELRKKD